MRLVLGLMLSTSILPLCALLESPVWAGSRTWSNRDWSREAERAREQAQQAAERARELAQQAAERARQQAQQAAERAARQQARQSRDDDDDNDRQIVATPAAPRRDQDTGQNKRNDKDKDNDKDDGGDRSGSQRNRDKREANRNNQDSSAPPATVVEFFKRLAAPTQPKTQEPVPALVPTQTITTGAVPIQKAKQNAAPPPPAKKPPLKLRVGPLGPPPVLANNTIVGVRLNSAALKRVTELGFKVAPASPLFQPRTTGVTQLVAPELLSTAAALDLLHKELPGDRFGLNYAYRPYEVATGDKPEAPGVRQASFGGCTAQRCYGPAVIGWQPSMRSCARDVRIGVIDTSIDRNHPAFKGRNLHIANFLPNGARRAPNWHGTGVMAVLAGNPDSGTPGLVPDASFFAANVYHSDEHGQPVADTASLLQALDWMRASKVHVINMSMSGPQDELIEGAIKELSARGVLFVAAAGNGGPNAPKSFPAAYKQVIAVTAVGKDLRGYVHANHGDYIDVAAPGVGIWTALPNLLEGYQSGTSFAAPHVTAILAAAHDRVRQKSKEEILSSLDIRDLGPAGPDRIYGRGLALAPAACSPGHDPGGWVTNIVRAPVTPLESIPSGLTARPSGYK